MLVIAVALIFFHLGKTTHPTITFQKQKREVRLASPIFPVPDFRKPTAKSRTIYKKVVVPKKVKSKSPAIASKKFRKHRRSLSKAPSVGTAPKLVRE